MKLKTERLAQLKYGYSWASFVLRCSSNHRLKSLALNVRFSVKAKAAQLPQV
jgi:hypothetical protein